MMAATPVAAITFPFDPVPASRPKVSRWGVYYAKNYRTWLELAKDSLLPGAAELEETDDVLVVIIAVKRRPKTSKACRPNGDVDNYAKGPMDVITKVGGFWRDDGSVTLLVSAKRFAGPGEQERTEAHIYRLAK